MIKLDDKEIKEYENRLKGFAERSFPFATKFTMNKAGFELRKDWQGQIDKQFVNRNKWTKGSIRVDQTKTLDVRKQQVTVGSRADYLATQEFGGTIRKTGKQGVSIATSYSAGQGESSKPRTRVPRKANRIANIQLRKRRQSKKASRAQQNFLAVRAAATSSNKFVYLDLGKRKGLFKVTGGKRKPKVKMVHDLSNTAVTIKRTPTLQPALEQTQRKVPKIYKDALLFQLKRQGLA